MLSKRDYKRLHYLIQIAYIAVFIFIVYLAFRYIFGAIAPFIIAFISASLVEPLVNLLVNKLRFPRGLASSVSIVLLLVAVILLGTFLSTTIISEAKTLLSSIPDYIRSAIEYMKDIIQNGRGIFSMVPEETLSTAISYLSNYDYSSLFKGSLGSVILGYAGNVVTSIPNILIFFIVSVVSSIFMSIAFPTVKKFALAQFRPEQQELIIEIKHSLFSTIGKYLRSYSMLMLITFVELLIFFLVFGFKPALTLAFLIAIVDILPVLGVGTVLIPWAAFCLLSGSPWRALLLACMYVVITIVRQILEPKVIGDHVGMLPILTLFCIWVGLKLFGFGGMFLIPITVVILKNLHESGKIHLWKTAEKGENNGTS
ncbi:MAG: sporulation integral membrane protein YtvI [Clostridia bacterium]|nr:sporulation integral membrane protein YtvI [Clostridia bacterium]